MTKPSAAQAKILAGLFANDGKISVATSADGYNSATVLAIVKNGWVKPTSEIGEYPSGAPFQVHILSRDGVDALQKALAEAVKGMNAFEAG